MVGSLVRFSFTCCEESQTHSLEDSLARSLIRKLENFTYSLIRKLENFTYPLILYFSTSINIFEETLFSNSFGWFDSYTSVWNLEAINYWSWNVLVCHMNCIGEEMEFPDETDTTYDWFLPFLTSHFSPVQGGAHKHENVCLLSSNKQEPPLRHPVMRQPWKAIVRFIKWTIAKIFVPSYTDDACIYLTVFAVPYLKL